jgi:hypothetical protein
MSAAEDHPTFRSYQRRGEDVTAKHTRRAGGWSALVLALAASSHSTHAQIAVRNQGYIPFSDAPINYRSNDLNDPVARLQQQIERGSAQLEFDADHGYLKSVLKLLDVPIDSQTLVFSKTSFQYPKISPEHPRALYFNDDVYVGSVHEGKAVEIVSFDPTQGAIFYLLDERKVEHPAFQRAELDCTQCHIAAGTRGIPGVLLRSVYPTSTGTLVAGSKSYITDQESPLAERWGGWYVTNAALGHAGLANAAAPTQLIDSAHTDSGSASLAPLAPRYDSSSYLVASSDLVAQLVLAHQTQMHNLITLTNYKTRLALYAQSAHTDATAQNSGAAQSAGAAVPDASITDGARAQIQRPADQLVRYLLFVNEASLSGLDAQQVLAGSPFARSFVQRGPRDSKGRSLRDFDLSTRLFRFPCSYLIYSEAFDKLPEPAKSYVYHRLFEVLSGREQGAEFAQLSSVDRRAILEILLETKSGLPAEWHDYARSNHFRERSAAAAERAAAVEPDDALSGFNRDMQAVIRRNE